MLSGEYLDVFNKDTEKKHSYIELLELAKLILSLFSPDQSFDDLKNRKYGLITKYFN